MDLKELHKIIKFQFRIWNGVWWYTEEKGKKVYEKYQVLWYIDARDAMDLLDKVVWQENRSRRHYDCLWNNYCEVWIKTDAWWTFKSDCGIESQAEKEKGESSDSFKRACVNRGIGRFLYTLPNLYITKEEAKANKYNVTKFVKERYHDELKDWADLYNKNIL